MKDKEPVIWVTIEDTIKKVMKPFGLFHGFVSSMTLIILLVSLSVLGFLTYRNMQLSQATANRLELTNKYYVLQNQTSILLKVIDENLRESDKAKKGSAPMELKVQTAKIMYDMAQLKQIPLHILCGIAETESGWNTHAISSTGCVGLMQITPMYARVYLREKGINYKSDIWFDPIVNIICGISMLNDAQTEHLEKGRAQNGDWQVALHSYFWGSSNTIQLFGKSDQRVNVPNMAYSMRVVEASKKYKDLGL
jgi:hypothetical protein